MIRTHAEYRRTKQQVDDLRRQLADHRQALAADGDSPEEIQRQLDPLISFCEQMADEAALYERIATGDVPPLDDLADLGHFLIAARIAQGVTQRELARRLGISESIVSRDESNDYHGVTAERASRILKALEMKTQLTAKPGVEGAPVPPPMAQGTVASAATGTVTHAAADTPISPATAPTSAKLASPSGNTTLTSTTNYDLILEEMIDVEPMLARLGHPVLPPEGRQAKMAKPMVLQGQAA